MLIVLFRNREQAMASLQSSPGLLLPPLSVFPLSLASPASDAILIPTQNVIRSELEEMTVKPDIYHFESTPRKNEELQFESEEKKAEGRWKKEEHEKFLEGKYFK